MAQAEHPRSWSDLPTELAGLVLCRLPAYSDRVRFGAVCRHWSFSSAQHRLPPPLPCLAFSDGTFVSLPHSETFQLHDSASYHSSCGKWLVFSHDGTFSFKSPFSKVTMRLPNLSCHCFIDEPLEIINGRDLVAGTEESLNMDADMSLDKVVVCSALLVAAIIEIGHLNTVAFCRPGADSWLVSGLGSKELILDMVFYEGQLYVMDGCRDLLAIDVVEDNDSGKLRVSRIERIIEGPSPSSTTGMVREGIAFHMDFLAECHGALLMVRRTVFGKSSEAVRFDFELLEADFNSSQWVGVTSVGDDVALFFERSYSQSVCVSQYKLKGDMLKGNCIVIPDDGSYNFRWKGIPGSYAIYDISDGKTYYCKLSELLTGSKAGASWVFPQ